MSNKKIRALALFSGGLDSALAIKVVKDQNIEVIALNFVSHFFGGKNDKAENMAKQLGVQLEYVDFKKRHTEIVKNPFYGRGKNMNPCIDCHSLMFKVAGEMMEEFDAQFLISGEVLGQRPMSQNIRALEKVKGLSGMGEYVLRPLSAKLLPITIPEEKGWVDREKLLDINGRSRNRQVELMNFYGLIDYPSPGGGCLLTDPSYSIRLKILEDDELLEEDNFHLFELIKKTRFFRFDKKRYLFVGRNEESNLHIKEYAASNNDSFLIKGHDVSGPCIVGYGDLKESEKELAFQMFSRYSKLKGNSKIKMNVNENIIEIEPIDVDYVTSEMSKFQK